MNKNDKRLKIREFANNNDGEVIDDNILTSVKLKCKHGHVFSLICAEILHGRWCPLCGIKRRPNNKIYKSLEKLKKLSELYKISVFGDYKNNCSKMHMICSNGHLSERVVKNFFKNPGCIYCKPVKLNDIARGIISSKHGEILNIEKNKIFLRCNKGHCFTSSAQRIRRGHWCPQCKVFVSEEVCRQLFEFAFNKPFIKTRPPWLVFNGSRLELDGYCEEFNIAFEHNGTQHYKSTSFDIDLIRRKQLDDAKIKICSEHGVSLIVIRELFKYTSIEELKKIISEVSGADLSGFDIDWEDIYGHKKTFDFFVSEIRKKNIEILDKGYKSSREKYNARCLTCNYEWMVLSDSIKRNNCPKCSKKLKKTIEDAMYLAKKNGGKCLSITYINNYTKLKWQCNLGHVWLSSYNSVSCGSWCYKCGRVTTSRKLKEFHDKRKNIKNSDSN